MAEEFNIPREPIADPTRLNTQTETLSEKPAPIQAPYKNPLKTLRTFQGDVEDIVGKNKTSLTSIVIAEEQRREKILEEPAQTNVVEIKNKFVGVFSVLLFILGIFAIGGVYYYTTTLKNGPITYKTDALIMYAQKINTNVASSTRSQLQGTINAQKKSLKLPVNSVLYINTTGSDGAVFNIQDILTFLAPSMPPALLRSFGNTYMIGIYSFDTNEPFIILTTQDFGSSYAGMLKWEAAMPKDLGKIFNIPDVGTSTPYIFTDETLQNKDLRIIKDTNQKTILLYSFLDRNTLVITSNENILTAVSGKYTTNKMAK